jgi:hypothetical protein
MKRMRCVRYKDNVGLYILIKECPEPSEEQRISCRMPGPFADCMCVCTVHRTPVGLTSNPVPCWSERADP